MSRNSGYIFKTNNDQFAIAYHAEQIEEFAIRNKFFVHLFEDELCTKPVINEVTGIAKKVIKGMDKLVFIGYCD